MSVSASSFQERYKIHSYKIQGVSQGIPIASQRHPKSIPRASQEHPKSIIRAILNPILGLLENKLKNSYRILKCICFSGTLFCGKSNKQKDMTELQINMLLVWSYLEVS